MKLISLELKNFQKHKKFSCQFEDGLNLIVGSNWSGKTTLLRSITYVLFGASGVSVKVPKLVNIDGVQMSVRLQFSIGEKVYEVLRSKTNASITSEDQTLATGQTQVTAYIENLVGRSAKNFLNFNVVEQEDAQQLLKMGGAKISKLLNEVTGIDLIDTIEERAKNEYLELKWAKEKDDTTSERMEKLLAEYEPAVETANAIKNELTEYEGYSEKTRVKVEELSERVSQIEKAYLAAEETRIEQAQRIGQINQIDQAIQRLRVPTTPVTVEELSVLYKALQERTADYQAWKAADDELKRLEGDLGAIQGELDALPAGDLPEVDLQELKEAKDAHDQRHLEAKQRVKAATKALESTVCPTCHRPYESIDLSALQAELDEAKQAYEAVEEAWKAFKAYHDETLEEVARLREVQRTRDRLEEKRSKLQAEASACQVPESVDFDEVSGMQEDYARRYQKYQEEQSIQTELTRLYSERERLVTEVHELGEAKGPDDAEIIKAREDLAAARKERESITDRVSTLRASQAQYDSYLQQAEVALKAMQDEIDDVKAKAERANKIDALVKYLRKNRDAYSAAIWDQLLAYTSSFISEATGGDTTGLSRSVTGEFMYVENGYDFPADLCSGMQGAILGVSLKLALGAALGTQGELLLIDEATAGGTDENSLLFSQLLAGLNSQVIMVTHRQSDAVCANHVVKL